MTPSETTPTEADNTGEAEGTVLKLKRADITIGIQGSYTTLELDCDLKPEDIEWTTRDASIATVKNGVVTSVGPGITVITARYGNQTAECIVRCSLPVKQLRLVQAWAAIHEEELYIAWNNAVRNIPFGKIEPLR